MFLRRLYNETDNVRIDKDLKKDLNIRNSLDAAMQEDIRSAGHDLENESATDDDDVTKLKKKH
jgi:hypothetical protein